MRQVPLIAISIVFAVAGAPNLARADAGDLDPTFGTGGVARTVMGSSSAAYAVTLQTDGKLVAAGNFDFALGHFALARYETDGTLDASFGTAGVVTTPIQSSSAALGVVCQPDGKIVAAGFALTGSTYSFALVRYETDGTLDAGFGTGGIVVTTLAATAQGEGVALQSDDKIVVVGTTGSTSSDVALARYETDGMLDATFGTGGIVTTSIGPSNDAAHGVALQTDGRIVVAGSTNTGGSQSSFALVRYATDGTLDPAFGSGGIATTSFTGSSSRANAIVVQPDGKLVAAGDSGNGVALARYETDGALDPVFGTAGKIYLNPGPTALGSLQSVRYQSPHWLVAAGGLATITSINPLMAQTDALLMRFAIADGATDFTVTSGGAANEGFSDVVVQPDARVVGAGAWDGHFTLARYVTTTCGDTVVENPEVCDDGNQVDGDGCDSNCTPTACGNDIVTAGETCDDGNTTSGDCCSATCQTDPAGTACAADANPCTDDVCNAAVQCTHPPNTLPCDDGDACTTGDVCSGGQCQTTPTVCPLCESCDPGDGSCVAVPRAACSAPVEPGKARLQMRDAANDAADTLSWKWQPGAVAAYGSPNPLDLWALCLYSTSPTTTLLSRAVTRTGICGSKPCWRSSASGWSYKDPARSGDGIESIGLRAGVSLKGRIKLKAKGLDLTLPGLPLPLPVRAQLQAGNGSCWEATYSSIGAKKNDVTQFKGASD